jgi:hypothetical protein
MCRNKYYHEVIECNLIKEYLQEPLIQHSSRIFEFNSFLWRQDIANEYSETLRLKSLKGE